MLKRFRPSVFCLLIAACVSSLFLLSADVFATDTLVDFRVINSSQTSNASLGDPVTVTWSLVPDGTKIGSNESNFISFLDELHNVTNPTDDLTDRVWFAPIQNALDSFTNKSGLTYIYEPNDDGAELSTVNGRFFSGVSTTGEAGVRGDYRIAGYPFQGAGAFTSNPTEFSFINGFTPVDRGHSNTFISTVGNIELTLNALDFLISHETMHSVGSSHIQVNGAANLSAVTGSGGTTAGPQFADLLTLQRRYGDFYEKNGGNDTFSTATDLGTVDIDAPLQIGFDAGMGGSTLALQVRDSEVDFVSIDDDGDADFFRFTSISATDEVVINLTPRGPMYTYTNERILEDGERLEIFIDSSNLSDLSLSVLDSNGNTLQSVDLNGVGEEETITLNPGVGDFFVQVNGDADNIQFYALEISTAPAFIEVSTTTVAPTTNLLASQPVGGQQYLVDAARDPGQGQTFALDDDFTLEAITVQIGSDTLGSQNEAEDAAALSLNVYQLPVDPSSGEPILTLDDTTLLGSFSDPKAVPFDATTASTNPLFLTFNLVPDATAVLGTLSAGTTYVFTVTTSSTNDSRFRIERSQGNEFVDGRGIFTGGNNIPAQLFIQDLVFFLQGTDSFLVGDVNCDGSVDFLDISPFIAHLSSGVFSDKADIDGNGIVDFLDISPFIALLSAQ